MFHTELKELFMTLQYRKNKKELWNLVQNNPLYRQMSQETAEAIAVLMNVEGMWKRRERYLHKYKEEVTYDMCQALQELFEDGRLLRIEQGIGAFVALYKEFGIDREGSILRPGRKFALDRGMAEKYTDRYWA